MAHAQPGHRDQETSPAMDSSDKDNSSSSSNNNNNNTSLSFKFNAHAPEFVPRSQTQIADLSGYYYPYFQFFGGTAGSEWLFVGDNDPTFFFQCAAAMTPATCSKNVLTEDLQQKIVKQVEYLFSDMSLFANDTMAKHLNREHEGYVPISVIASMKKVKSLISNNHLLAQALRSSSKLVVSADGKKVKRRHAFTEKDKDELQARIVVVENLPEDHSHQNLEKIFSVVGTVKNIRICHPQESNSSRSPRCDLLIGNKLHALVEYETPEIAEAAVEKLNDETDWRKGLRVRLMLKCSPKSVLKNKRPDFDIALEEEEGPDFGDDIQSNNVEAGLDSNVEDSSQVGVKKGGGRGRGKLRGRSLSYNGRGLLTGCPQPITTTTTTQWEVPLSATKQNFRGPRMPDGTRGFTMGRGKPLTSSSSTPTTP